MDDASPKPKARPCPICGKPPAPRFKPFCSARCKTVDLGRWLEGRYAIRGDEPPETEPPEERER